MCFCVCAHLHTPQCQELCTHKDGAFAECLGTAIPGNEVHVLESSSHLPHARHAGHHENLPWCKLPLDSVSVTVHPDAYESNTHLAGHKLVDIQTDCVGHASACRLFSKWPVQPGPAPSPAPVAQVLVSFARHLVCNHTLLSTQHLMVSCSPCRTNPIMGSLYHVQTRYHLHMEGQRQGTEAHDCLLTAILG